MANVLFVCIHNAGRSQMSRAIFEQAIGGRHAADSAGTNPSAEVNPDVVEAMRELSIDISDRTPKKLSQDLVEWADVVVTMGCGDECPVLPGKRYIDWSLSNPKGLAPDQIREIRNQIDQLVKELIEDLELQKEDPDEGDAVS